MDRPDLPLNALRTFEVAVRQGSFTRAAIELRVTQAAVSHQIARLEELLGAKLLLRTPSGLVPTDEGVALYPVLEHGLDAISRVLDRVTGKQRIEVLKVGVVTTFALGWLIPRLPRFEKAHPEIELRISTNNNRVEITREGLDLAIRFGDGNWAKVEAWPLIDAPMSVLCAPEIAAGLRHPGDLAQHTLLRSYRSDEWSRWFAEIGVPCPPVTGPVLDSSLAIAELASQGFGIALLPLPMFAAQIEAGILAQPFGTTVFAGRYYLTCPSDRVQNAAMIAFSNWIRSESAVCAETRD